MLLNDRRDKVFRRKVQIIVAIRSADGKGIPETIDV